MSWTYEQSTGWLISPAGKRLARGYSGNGQHKNNPASQSLQDHGPIPQGTYSIGAPVNTATHGPYVLPLTPSSTNQMFGRGGFLIHGDSIPKPGTASLGCIIQPRFARERIWTSGDHLIQVV